MRKYDIDLAPGDIRQLSNLNEITAFFARLGYTTDVRTEQTVQNLGISAEGAKRAVKHIWLIADEDTLLQVYLFELKNITMTNIRELTRSFRNKAGNYLLVLASDYNRIDFVLIERIAPRSISTGIGIKQSGVRPRVLTVDRRNPDSISIRVLRRITYTETDPLFQYEKLLFAYSIADWSEDYFNNRALFSDYFLMNRFPIMSEWRVDPKPAYNRLKEIYQDGLSRYLSEREGGLRSKLYDPTFSALGFQYRHGKGATDPAHERPDYFLFSPTQDSKNERPLAVALVYPWGRSLDGKDDRRDKDTPDENPGASVVSLLEANQAPWAIVTNGQTWRLYSQKTHSRATNYYEIDLIEALSLGNPGLLDPAQAFRYYWLFFRYNAFEKKKALHEGKEVEHSFLDQILTGSEEYAKELGERLKERIFERILPHLAEGFIADIRRKEGKDTNLPQERLDHVFHGTLTLLYRLLFLLYAESRDLLPAKEVRGYYDTSIKKLKTEIAEKAGVIEDESSSKIAKHYRADEFEIYNRMTRLFQVIDKGDDKLNVPVYNGGLFITDVDQEDESAEAVNAQFLCECAVPDRYFAQAIDLMARDVDDKRQDLVFIDYKSLGVRQLGSMYEGLLEFRLRLAREKMAIVKGKKTEEVITYKEAISKKRKILTTGKGKTSTERILTKGSVYLENDKKERKATGSYYTPQHIVNYIVEQTVGPVLKEKLEKLRLKLREVEQRRRAFDEKQEALKKGGYPQEPEEKKLRIGIELVDEVFNTRTLDPAMGSGHFLVQAVDFITDKILDFLNAFPANPVHYFLENTRDTILKEMDKQRITIDAGRLTDVNLLKRHVLKRCIYGVDLNPMAVELAKVSLWLDCFTLGAPLSFLDHHLRCGNSLIGVSVDEAKDFFEKGQLWLFGTPFEGVKMAADLMRQVGFIPDVTSSDVSESRKKYKQAKDALAPYKRILDVYASRWFGNEPKASGRGKKKEVYDRTRVFLQSDEAKAWLQNPIKAKLSDENRSVAETASRSSTEKRFFHWELEFPEVFYGPRPGTTMKIERLEGAGFDAVVGNPPYDVLAEKELGYDISEELGFYKGISIFDPAIRGKNNLYKLFICRGIGDTKQTGYLSFIVPMALLGDNHSAGVRQLLLEESSLENIEVFPQKDDSKNRVFFEAKLSTSIFVTKKDIIGSEFILRLHPGNDLKIYSNELKIPSDKIGLFDSENLTIPCCQQKDWEIVIKLLNLSKIKRLGEYCKAYQGEINETTDSKHGFITKNPKDGPQILRGSTITLYAVREQSQGETIYLKKEKYLNKKKKSVRAEHHLYDRIGWQESSAQNNFRRIISAKIPKGEFCNHKINYIPKHECKLPLEFILAILNSKIGDWYFRLGSTNNAVSHYQIYNLPVPTIADSPISKDLKAMLNSEDWKELFDSLKTSCDGSGQMPFGVMTILADLSNKIGKIENRRVLKNRSERSRLDYQSQKLQDIIDVVLFNCYGLDDEESNHIEKRLGEML